MEKGVVAVAATPLFSTARVLKASDSACFKKGATGDLNLHYS